MRKSTFAAPVRSTALPIPSLLDQGAAGAHDEGRQTSTQPARHHPGDTTGGLSRCPVAWRAALDRAHGRRRVRPASPPKAAAGRRRRHELPARRAAAKIGRTAGAMTGSAPAHGQSVARATEVRPLLPPRSVIRPPANGDVGRGRIRLRPLQILPIGRIAQLRANRRAPHGGAGPIDR